jgi:DNA-binding GntR family transcriptional regulator
MLTHSIVERIKASIESGSLRTGTPIGQQQLADQLGVSRQPIRQALPLLIAEGWIESLPNRRLLVRELASSEIEEIFAVRRLLEPVALAASIARATPAMLRRVNFALTEYEEADTPAELESADVAFHEAL